METREDMDEQTNPNSPRWTMHFNPYRDRLPRGATFIYSYIVKEERRVDHLVRTWTTSKYEINDRFTLHGNYYAKHTTWLEICERVASGEWTPIAIIPAPSEWANPVFFVNGSYSIVHAGTESFTA